MVFFIIYCGKKFYFFVLCQQACKSFVVCCDNDSVFFHNLFNNYFKKTRRFICIGPKFYLIYTYKQIFFAENFFELFNSSCKCGNIIFYVLRVINYRFYVFKVRNYGIFSYFHRKEVFCHKG